MKRKGFTLVELLAVIVILAAIALIATPIVTKVIDQSEKESAKRSAENYIKAVDIAIGAARLDGVVEDGKYRIKSEDQLCLSDDKCLTVEVNGNQPSGTITIKDEEVVMSSIELTIGDYTVAYDVTNEAYVATYGSYITIYRWSPEEITVGDTIADPTNTYTIDPATLGYNIYLKHVLDKDNIVVKSYACVTFSGNEECVQGGIDDNGNSYYNDNILVLNRVHEDDFTCDFGANSSYCYSDSGVGLYVASNGDVRTDGDGSCYVNSDGSSHREQ